MIRLDLTDDNLLHVEAPARLAPLIATIPGLRQHDKHWAGPATPALMFAIASELSSVSGFDPSPAAVDRMLQYQHQRDEIDEAKRNAPDEYDDRLYDYQHAGVHLLLNGGTLLGDEMGTGKTVMALTAARQVGGAVLVVAPNSMKHRWAEEAAVWYPEAITYVLEGTANHKRNLLDLAGDDYWQGLPVIVTTNWESLRTLSSLAPYGSVKRSKKEQEPGPLNERIPWNVVIADEAHRAKDPKSKQTRALWAVAQQAQYRWALTGTPVLNTPGDLWSIGRFYDPLAFGPSRHKWHNRYVDYVETQWGPKDIGLRKDREREFMAWFDLAFIRRTKDEVLDLPDITYQTRRLEMGSKQGAAYRRLRDEMIAQLDDGILIATDPLALLTRLSQLASALPVLDDEGGVAELTKPSNKVDALVEILQEAGDEGGQVVVFAQSRKLIDLAEETLDSKGYTSMRITGSEPANVRAVNVQRFQAGEVQVALCTLGAGSEGINLYSASTLVFLQRSYAYGMNIQAEARVHRNGQTRPVTVIDLVSKDTVDELVIEALQSKGEVAEQVLRDTVRGGTL